MSSLIDLLRFELDEKNLPIRAEQVRARIDSYPLMLVAELVLAPMLVMLMWDKISARRAADVAGGGLLRPCRGVFLLAPSSHAHKDRCANIRPGIAFFAG